MDIETLIQIITENEGEDSVTPDHLNGIFIRERDTRHFYDAKQAFSDEQWDELKQRAQEEFSFHDGSEIDTYADQGENYIRQNELDGYDIDALKAKEVNERREQMLKMLWKACRAGEHGSTEIKGRHARHFYDAKQNLPKLHYQDLAMRAREQFGIDIDELARRGEQYCETEGASAPVEQQSYTSKFGSWDDAIEASPW